MPGDEVAGDYKEDVYADEPAGETLWPQVEQHNRRDGESAQGLDFRSEVGRPGSLPQPA